MIIDVILITYNQEQYVRRALESLAAQKAPKGYDVHVIVADDASSDKTLNIIHDVLDCLRFDVEYCQLSENLGISRNYQRAFKKCKGDYLAILEGDDYWLDGHLEQHVGFLNEHTECSMSMSTMTVLSQESGSMSMCEWCWNDCFHLVSLKDQIVWCNMLGNLSACMFRTSCIKRLPEKMFDLHVDDFIIGVMMAEMGYIGLLKDSTSVYRVNENSLWASKSSRAKYKRNMIYAKQYNRLQDYKYNDYWAECVRILKRQERNRLVRELKKMLSLERPLKKS